MLAGAAMGLPAVHMAAQRQGMAADGGTSAQTMVEKAMIEIDDPNLGTRWLLRRNPAHPGGPGIIETATCTDRELEAGAPPVIHAGDRVILEEDSKVVEARLEAIALGAAAEGKTFRARVRIGGKLVRAVAVSAGRAMLLPEVPR
jgi:hypothetical protein